MRISDWSSDVCSSDLLTFDFTDNEHRMSDYLTDRLEEIAKVMQPREIKSNRRKGHYSIVPYQTTHNTGGTIMGTSPRDSVVNPFLQSWDVHNVFVMGAEIGRASCRARVCQYV